MSSFIESCRCNGRQPSGVVAKKRIARPEAVGLLLKDREVPRFLVAPTGYGKTHVAFEYASIIFAFKHVMWLRCGSPCFVRDLDAATILEGILAADPKTALVVFDDVPIMDQSRCDALSRVIDALLETGCEVVISCSPSADAYGSSQKDRVLLTSRDLLLEEAEVAACGLASVPHGNIACIAWGSGSAKELLKGCAKEAMPADLKCAMVRMLVYGTGGISTALGLFDAAREEEICLLFARYYTFLGVQLDEGRFSAIEVEIADIKSAFLSSLDEVHGSTPLPSADALGVSMADALLDASLPRRAQEVIAAYVSKAGMLLWLEKRGWSLILQGHPLIVADLAAVAIKRRRQSPFCTLLRAGAFWALGRDEEACALCRKACASEDDARVRVAAFALLTHVHREPLEPDETLAFAESLAALQAEERTGAIIEREEPDWMVLGQMMFPLSLGDVIEQASWQALVAGIQDDAGSALRVRKAASALLGIAWTVSARCVSAPEDDAQRRMSDDLLDAFAAFVRQCMEGAVWEGTEQDMLLFPLSVAITSIEEAKGPSGGFGAVADPVLARRIVSVRASLERQGRETRRRTEEAAQSRAKFESTHPDPYRKLQASPVMSAGSVPQLEVRMFGGLDMRIDGELIDPRRLSRKRTRTLAAALALNKGHELTRERLCQIVWPGADPQMCVNSFYSVWASLKRALSLEGSCPYLVRSQVGCSLDARYLMTDMDEFEAMCNSLVFGTQQSSWEELYGKVTGSFSESLLPSEMNNPYISDIRERCKNRLVDGLLAVSQRLISLDERTGALWFTREAMRRDDGREDVYIALMEAQIAANQRGPALDTYFKCRKFLSEGLGIDPSPKLVELYRSIIEYEEDI